MFHAFFECTWARLFWEEMKKATNIKIPLLHPTSWPSDIVEGRVVCEEHACTIICGAWAVWMERNARWHGEGGRSIGQSVKWATETAIDLCQVGKEKKDKPRRPLATWKPPAPEVIKINVDAGFRIENMDGTTGVVLRDHRGKLIRAQALWYKYAASPLIMEAEAVRDGVRLATDLALQRIQLETDSLEVVNAWKDSGTGRSIITSIVNELKELSGLFSSFEIKHVSRSANMAAHACAHRANEDRRRCVWVNYNPPFLASILAKDFCNSSV
jgi:ribonuclease HI